MVAAGFVYHERCLDHDAGAGHPESPDRVSAIAAALEASGLMGELDRLEPYPASRPWLESVHDPRYVEAVGRACARAPARLDPDTRVSAGSERAARLAVGGALASIDRILALSWRNAFVCCRPPGHHAERARGMGFCLYNTAAVAAAYLRANHRLDRVAILDWDVHHGNGTQHLFESDPSVFYASLHQWPLYPGTGAASERGTGAGEGTTLNCPLAAGAGDAEWLGALETRVLPELERFRPEFLIVSAGFDAHEQDPLAQSRVSTDGFRRMTRAALDFAERACEGRVVSLLEGGYDLAALAASAHAHVEELRRAADAAH